MSTEAQLEGFFDALMGEGTAQERGLAFTLESEKARKKLQEFAVAHPEHFQLLALAGLYALGARKFEVTADADDFALRTEILLEREMFEKLWSRAGGSGSRHGARLLALSFLTSARLDDVEWRVFSSDGQGPWSYRLPIKGGEVAEAQLGPGEPSEGGSRLAVKRRSLGLVAKRYLGRLRDRLVQREGADERLLRERLFLTKDSQLSVNGTVFQRSHAALPVNALALMESGPVPPLVECDLQFRSDGSHTVGVILVHPTQTDAAALPGERNSILWIWNGLTMDRSSLGEEFSYFRAFVWADELQPDLSLSQLISNKAKQTVERAAKTLARDLLHNYVTHLTQELLAQGDTTDDEPFRERLKVIKKALRDRISLKRARNRLASLNRALIACPILLGSDSLGQVRWWSFEQIWIELEQKRSVAASPTLDTRVVPACPERPVVLVTQPEDWEMLSALLPAWALKKTGDVLKQIEDLEQGAAEAPEPSGDFHGAFQVSGIEFAWKFASTLEFSALACPRSGGTVCLRPWSPALQGFFVTTGESLEASYGGGLVDGRLAQTLERRLIEELCRVMAQSLEGPQGAKYLEACHTVLQSLAGSLAAGPLRELDWLPVYSVSQGLERISLFKLEQRLSELDSPCFELTRAPEVVDPLPAPWSELPFVLCQPRSRAALRGALGHQVVPGRWLLKTCVALPDLGAEVWSGSLPLQDCPKSVESLKLLVAPEGELAKGETRRVECRAGVAVQDQTRAWVYPGLKLEVHWSQGWPGCEGSPWILGGEGREEDLSAACLVLGRQFLEQAGAEAFLKASPELVAGWTFDLLSDPTHRDLKVFLRADGQKLSLGELPSEIEFFSRASDLSQVDSTAFYLPGELSVTMELLSEGLILRPYSAPMPGDLAASPAKDTAEPKADRQKSPTSAKPVVAKSMAEPVEEGPGVLETPCAAVPNSEKSQAEAETPVLQRPDLSPGVAQLAQDIWDLAPAEIAPGFAEYVGRCDFDLEVPGLFRNQSSERTIGRRGWDLCQRWETRAYLHSALFSAYNRATAEVTDQHERDFHHALVSWLISRKGSLGPEDKVSLGERTTLE